MLVTGCRFLRSLRVDEVGNLSHRFKSRLVIQLVDQIRDGAVISPLVLFGELVGKQNVVAFAECLLELQQSLLEFVRVYEVYGELLHLYVFEFVVVLLEVACRQGGEAFETAA